MKKNKNTAFRTLVQNTVDDMVTNFFYYDRKGDDELQLDALENALRSGDLTKQDIIDMFAAAVNSREIE